jgi:hypothetical protein
MAILSTVVGTAMNIKFKAGLDSLGNDIIKGRKYSNLKVNSIDDDILSVATALGNLLRYEVVEVLRSNDLILAEA